MDSMLEKRKREGDENVTITIPTTIVEVGNSTTAMKILVPSPLCGPIIGKGGTNIAELNRVTNAKIRLSGNGSVFPGTPDRIAVITGPGEIVMAAIETLINRMFEVETDLAQKGHITPSPPTADLRVNILIPFSAAGVIIGRGGDHVKQIRHLHACKIRVGDAVDPCGTRERTLTVSANSVPPIVRGVQQILLLLMKETGVGVYASLDTNYGSVPNPGPTGPALDHFQPPSDPYYGASPGYPQQYDAPPPRQYDGQPPRQYQRSYDNERRDASPYPHADSGYAAPSSVAQVSAMPPPQNRLASNPSAYPYAGAATRPPQQYQPQAQPQRDSIRHMPAHGYDVSTLEITPPMYQTDGATVTMTLGVPDAKVGALIGRGGMVIREIKAVTGAAIHLSQKEDRLPGTSHRRVTVTGSQEQVQHAQSVIMGRLMTADSHDSRN